MDKHMAARGGGKIETYLAHYVHLLIMIALSWAVMYWLMYAMVDSSANVFSNFNQFYMSGLMAAPMVLIELGVMRSMYSDRVWNGVFIAGSMVTLALCWLGIRQQIAISDRQFLRSMIPHHAGAILMCQQASLQDSEIRRLCSGIVSGQEREIATMKAKLKDLDAVAR